MPFDFPCNLNFPASIPECKEVLFVIRLMWHLSSLRRFFLSCKMFRFADEHPVFYICLFWCLIYFYSSLPQKKIEAFLIWDLKDVSIPVELFPLGICPLLSNAMEIWELHWSFSGTACCLRWRNSSFRAGGGIRWFRRLNGGSSWCLIIGKNYIFIYSPHILRFCVDVEHRFSRDTL